MKFDLNTIHTAWQRVKAKGKSGGIDGQSIDGFESGLKANLKALLADLNEKTYAPEPPVRINIPKDRPYETRPIGLLTVRDKIAQHAVRIYIEPLIEKKFSPFSYAYRPQKGHGKAVAAITGQIKQGFVHVLALDIDNYFDSIDHDILTGFLKAVPLDEYFIHLLQCWFKIGVFKDGIYLNHLTGIHQGGVLSPLLSNLYLTPFDRFIVKEYPRCRYVRYADNFLLMSRQDEDAGKKISQISDYLRRELKLSLNPAPERMASLAEGIEFCGIHFQGNQGKFLRVISQKKFHKALDHIDSLCRRYLKNPSELVQKINFMLLGWDRYYYPYDTHEQIHQLENVLMDRLKLSGLTAHPEYKLLLSQIAWLTLSKRKEEQKHDPVAAQGIEQTSKSEEHKPEPRMPCVRHKILMKRKKYQKLFIQRYDLALNKPGMYLGKKESSLVIRYQNRELQSSPLAALKRIAVQSPGCSISTDALFACAENNIRLELIQWDGKPAALLLPPQSEDWKISVRQVKSAEEPIARDIACRIIKAKILNQVALLKYFLKNKKNDGGGLQAQWAEEQKRIRQYLEGIDGIDWSLSQKELSEKIFGYEGLSAGSYWKIVGLLIPAGFAFTGRVRKGAQDIVNVCLNYGYGILYTRVWAAVMQARLNPQISFFHLYQKEKPALVYDLIEPFRQPVVDRTVIGMMTKKEIAPGASLINGRLDDDLRRKLAMKIIMRLEAPFIYRNKETTLNDQIFLACLDLADVLMGKKKTYKPFLMKW